MFIETSCTKVCRHKREDVYGNERLIISINADLQKKKKEKKRKIMNQNYFIYYNNFLGCDLYVALHCRQFSGSSEKNTHKILTQNRLL